MVKPCDEESNKAEGPTLEEMQRVERLLHENLYRPKLAGTGSNSIGSATRYLIIVPLDLNSNINPPGIFLLISGMHHHWCSDLSAIRRDVNLLAMKMSSSR